MRVVAEATAIKISMLSTSDPDFLAVARTVAEAVTESAKSPASAFRALRPIPPLGISWLPTQNEAHLRPG